MVAASTTTYDNIPPEDTLLVQNIVSAMQSLQTGSTPTCSKYKIEITPIGYLVHATLPSSEHFEIHLDDFLFLQSVSPSRIEHVAIARRPPNAMPELIVHILDFKQRILVTSSVSFSKATRKRKWTSVFSSSSSKS